MDLFVAIQVDDEGAFAALEKLTEAVSPMSLSAFMDEVVVPYHREVVAGRFSEEKDPTGQPWEPLAFMTQEERATQGFGAEHPILRRTGELFQYLTSGGDISMFPMGAEIQFPKSAGTPDAIEKFETNQLGAMNLMPSGNTAAVPARPMLGWSDTDLAQVMTLLSAWVVGEQKI